MPATGFSPTPVKSIFSERVRWPPFPFFHAPEKPIARDHFRAEGEQLPRDFSTRVSSGCKGNDGKNFLLLQIPA